VAASPIHFRDDLTAAQPRKARPAPCASGDPQRPPGLPLGRVVRAEGETERGACWTAYRSTNGTQGRARWFHLTPGRFVLFLLVVECLLWLSERFGWLPWHKGYAVLTGVAAVGLVVLGMVVWFGVAVVFRRRFQFRLRTLLVLVVALAFLCSWLKVDMNKASEQAKAVEALRKLDGDVAYDYEFDFTDHLPLSPRPNAQATAPLVLRDMLGEDFFARIVTANVSQPIVFDLGLPQPGDSLKNERDDPPIDAGLECLSKLPELKVLYLEGSVVTDAGLESLRELTQLLELDLDRTQITDRGLEHVEGMPRLKVLLLDFDRITDAGMKHVQSLSELRELGLSGTSITNGGLEHLRGLNQLQVLGLGSTSVSDAGLEHLAGLTQLQHLDLARTKVTDAGLAIIARQHPQLRELSVFGSQVTGDEMNGRRPWMKSACATTKPSRLTDRLEPAL
jgi:hypothetical protein